MPRQKYGGHFSRATVFQRRGFSTLSRQTIARRPFLVNRVICPLIKRVINSTGSSYALLKTDSRPVHFACFALVDSRHIATRFNIFSSCFFQFTPLSIFFFFYVSIWVFLLRSDPTLSRSFLHDRFRKGEDKFLVKSSDTRTTIYGLLRKGFPWEVKPWYAAKGLRVNFGWF